MIRLRVVLLLVSLCLVPVSFVAADDTSEIIYRASLGRADDVKLLLKNGASANEKNSSGVPALALAATRKDEEGLAVVKALVEGGAAINDRDAKGQNALFYASSQGNVDIVNYLLAKHIDASAIDVNGDLPRTIAYRAGYMNIVAAIDNAVGQQHYADQIAVQEEVRAEKEKQSKATSNPPPAQSAPAAQVTAATPDTKIEVIDEKTEKEKDQASYDLAFHACAFQYWDFCNTSKQSTELEDEELSIAIQSHQDKAESIKKILLNDYKMEGVAIDAIQDSAQQRIFTQLNSIPTHEGRREKGVGKMDDMDKRCKEIARQWNAPGTTTEKPADTPSKSNVAAKPVKPAHTFTPIGSQGSGQ